MFARVARWEGGDSDAIRRAAEEVRPWVESGLPVGIGQRKPVETYEVAVDVRD